MAPEWRNVWKEYWDGSRPMWERIFERVERACFWVMVEMDLFEYTEKNGWLLGVGLVDTN